jgi:hypothetical protein
MSEFAANNRKNAFLFLACVGVALLGWGGVNFFFKKEIPQAPLLVILGNIQSDNHHSVLAPEFLKSLKYVIYTWEDELESAPTDAARFSLALSSFSLQELLSIPLIRSLGCSEATKKFWGAMFLNEIRTGFGYYSLEDWMPNSIFVDKAGQTFVLVDFSKVGFPLSEKYLLLSDEMDGGGMRIGVPRPITEAQGWLQLWYMKFGQEEVNKLQFPKNYPFVKLLEIVDSPNGFICKVAGGYRGYGEKFDVEFSNDNWGWTVRKLED